MFDSLLRNPGFGAKELTQVFMIVQKHLEVIHCKQSVLLSLAATQRKMVFEQFKVLYAQNAVVFDMATKYHSYECDNALSFREQQDAAADFVIEFAQEIDFCTLFRQLLAFVKKFSDENFVRDNYDDIASVCFTCDHALGKITYSAEQILQHILVLQQDICKHQSVYINFISTECQDDDDNALDDQELDKYNQLAWAIQMVLVREFINNGPKIGVLEQFLYQFGFRSIHTHCNVIIKNALIPYFGQMKNSPLVRDLILRVIGDFGSEKLTL